MCDKMELPQKPVIGGACGVYVWGEVKLVGDGAGQAHKTKQATRKHLALLASLGKFGLSEHMALEVDLRRQGRASGARSNRVGAQLSAGGLGGRGLG